MVPLAAFLALTGISSWVCDDAFIAFRYSRNLAEGLGLRFNVGVEPPVEGYTQLGWILWIGLFEWLGLDPTVWSRVTGIAAGAALLLCVFGHARRRMGLNPLPAAAAALFFGTAPTAVVWATGGLGTMPFALALFVTAERLLGDPDRPRGVQATMAAVCAVILRADAPFWLGLILALGLLRARRHRSLLRPTLGCAVTLGVVLGTVFLWRLSYYGDWLPNTARAKVGMSGPALERGFEYVAHYWLTVPAVGVAFLACAVMSLGRSAHWLRVATVLSGGTFAYGILVSGDFMAMGRFFLPALPFLALAVGRLVALAQDRAGSLVAGVTTALMLALSVPALNDVHATPQSWRESVNFRWGRDYETEYRFWQGMIDRSRRWSDVGRALGANVDPESSLVRSAIGGVGYYSRMFIYDLNGLVNRDVVAEVEVDPSELRHPGHDRTAPLTFFDRFSPTYTRVRIMYATDPSVATRVERMRRQAKYEIHEIERRDGYLDDGWLVLWRFGQ